MLHFPFSGLSRVRLTWLVSIMALASAGPVTATIYTWDPSGDAGVQSGSGIWDTSGANTAWTTDGGGSNVAWIDGVVTTGSSGAIFAGDDSGGVITVTGSRTIAVDGNVLSFLNSGYTLQSDSSTERLIEFRNSTGFLISAGKSVTIGNKVTLQNGFIRGGGTVIIESGGKINSGGTSISGSGTEIQVKTGGAITTLGTISVGAGTGDHTSLVVDGGTVSVSATSQGNLALNNSGTATNASSEATLNSGSITLAGTSSRVLMGAANNATVTTRFNLNGGTLTTSGVTDTTASVSTFNFNGGILKAGALANGLITAASGNFVDALNNAVVQTRGAKIDSNGSDIKIAAALRHDTLLGGTLDGGFEKLGVGSVILSGVNTFTGVTTVTAGTLATDATGTFGAGNVLVLSGATLTMGNVASITEAASLTFSATSLINLDFDGTVNLSGVILSGSGSIGSGTYTAEQLNTYFDFTSGDEVFFGNGMLGVTVIPEPATWASLTGAGGLLLAAGRRRRLRMM